MWIDAHNHLGDTDEETRTAILARSGQDTPVHFFVNTISPGDWHKAGSLLRSAERIFPFYGIHPWFADKAADGWETALMKLLKEPQCGVGEIGLDKAKKEIDFMKQQAVFSKQVEMASALRKPFNIHCVRAWNELLQILKPNRRVGARFLLHAFRGPLNLIPELIEMGAYFSFSWKRLRMATPENEEAVRLVPEERLLIETDFPYLGKEKDGTRVTADDYFFYLSEAYRKVASLRGILVEQLERAVEHNGTVFLYGNSAR